MKMISKYDVWKTFFLLICDRVAAKCTNSAYKVGVSAFNLQRWEFSEETEEKLVQVGAAHTFAARCIIQGKLDAEHLQCKYTQGNWIPRAIHKSWN